MRLPDYVYIGYLVILLIDLGGCIYEHNKND